MRTRSTWQAGFGLGVCAFAFLYVAYGLAHPPRARALRYQGVNTIRNISIVFTNAGTQQSVFPANPTIK